jgi:hypothetical protein
MSWVDTILKENSDINSLIILGQFFNITKDRVGTGNTKIGVHTKMGTDVILQYPRCGLHHIGKSRKDWR